MPEDGFSKELLCAKIKALQQKLEGYNQEKTDLEIMLETITEHSTDLENEIYQKHKDMLIYLQQVDRITEAAAAFENQTFSTESLNEVADREDELGLLARVFQRMVEQVKNREETLKRQVQELRIEIDESKQARRVAEIVSTDYFQNLKHKLKKIKNIDE